MSRELIKEGNDPKCQHEHCFADGHGTVVFFEECSNCGARFSTFTGHDPFLAQMEADCEPRE